MDGLLAFVRDCFVQLDRVPAKVTLGRVARLPGVRREVFRFNIQLLKCSGCESNEHFLPVLGLPRLEVVG